MVLGRRIVHTIFVMLKLEPFRFPEAAAQPASSLSVRGVHALQVRRPCVRSALLGLERE